MKKPVLPTSALTKSEASANGEVIVVEKGQSSACRQPVDKPPVETRDRVRRLLVGVTPIERAEIERRAEVAGLSVSGYLRSAALHHKIRSTFDYSAVRELCKVSGDLGRFAGLLKLWLAERRNQGSSAVDVDRTLREARALMDELRERIGKI